MSHVADTLHLMLYQHGIPHFFSRIIDWKIIMYYWLYRKLYYYIRWRCPALGQPLLWAISFFFKWEENKYFSSYAYCFIFKSDLLNSNFVEKNSYFLLFFLISKVNFWMFGFIETKSLNIDSFTNETWNKFKCHQSKVSRRKEKKVCC